jgi:hypothetical protein
VADCSPRRSAKALLVLSVLLNAMLCTLPVAAALPLLGGNLDVYLRYRFEHVDDDQGAPLVKNAHAHTLRTAIGYESGLFHGFGAQFQFEDVRAIDRDGYNDGGTNGITDRAVVVDPQGIEIQQANVRFEGLPKTVLRVGRQEIEHRRAPMHRYVGNVLWRQNWQSFDAFRATSRYLPDTTVDYAYVWNVNRIFGRKNPLPDRAEFDVDAHLLNVQYRGFSLGEIEAYAYLLDFNTITSRRFSTQTFGARFGGGYPVAESVKVLYTAEYAHQGDYGSNPNDVSVNYWLAEIGAEFKLAGPVESITAKASYEVLGGKGGLESFQTPFGTNHAFQGWADRFLVTPGDGIEDLFFTVRAAVLGATFIASYHFYESDNGGYRYGEELNLQLERPFFQRMVAGLKFADYRADRNALNIARNSATGQAFDLTRFWFYLQLKF